MTFPLVIEFKSNRSLNYLSVNTELKWGLLDSILIKEETDFIEPQLLRNHTKSEIFVIRHIGIVYCTS